MPTQTLSWSGFGNQGSQAADFTGVNHNTGAMTVRATLIQDGQVGPGDIISSEVDSGEVNTSGNYNGRPANSSLQLDNGGGTGTGSSPAGDSNTVSLRLDFTSNNDSLYGNGAQNVSFWISDIDRSSWQDQVRILAYDVNGQLTDVTDIILTTSSRNLTINHATDEITATGGGNVAANSANGAVQVTIPGPITHLIIDYDNLSTGDQRVEISDITFDTIDPNYPWCFTLGTRIRTPMGERAVEDLKVGDLVLTRDNGTQPIRWIGSRTVCASGGFAPIHIAKEVFGNTGELVVSPEHRMLVSDERASLLFGENEVLVAARHLVDGDRIWQQTGGEVTYFHVMFERHELIWAEGCLSESFHLGEKELAGVATGAREEILALFPELDLLEGDTPLARPRLTRSEAQMLR